MFGILIVDGGFSLLAEGYYTCSLLYIVSIVFSFREQFTLLDSVKFQLPFNCVLDKLFPKKKENQQ